MTVRRERDEAWASTGETLDGWSFVPPDHDGEVRVGETLTVDGPLVLYQRGLHASVLAWDALPYARGPILCRVRLSGTIVEGPYEACATARTVLAMADVERELRIFALGVARAALLAEQAAGLEPDPRSWAAIETTIAWMEGRASDADQRAAANAAASVAARWCTFCAADLAAHATATYLDRIVATNVRYAGRMVAWRTSAGERRAAENEVAALFERHVRAAMKG
jgi:hypothetical protein